MYNVAALYYSDSGVKWSCTQCSALSVANKAVPKTVEKDSLQAFTESVSSMDMS